MYTWSSFSITKEDTELFVYATSGRNNQCGSGIVFTALTLGERVWVNGTTLHQRSSSTPDQRSLFSGALIHKT